MKRMILSTLGALLLGLTITQAQSTYRSQLPAIQKKGATVTGVVECDGKPVAGVVVSDGYLTSLTDAKGRYSLNSLKQNGQVFISVPSGYEAWCDDVVPQFWANLAAPALEPERCDFRLKKVDNSKHVILALADPHIANRHDDVAQFTNGCLPRIREEVEKYRAQGIPVYTMCLGDSSWDRLWYELCFMIGDFRDFLNTVDYPTPLYNVIGNHDNDGAVPAGPDTDAKAAQPYMDAFGPRYYSFNAGGVHYVVLDNVVFLNEGNTLKKDKNIAGSCNYKHRFTPEQLEWLEKDLSYITDKNTPVVVGTHCPVYRYRWLTGEPYFYVDEENAKEFLSILEDYPQVHLLTGHIHYNQTTRVQQGTNTVIDHNIAGACGAWWLTGSIKGGLNLCPNGIPAGFGVFAADGQDISWYYASFEDGPEKQFRAFDINAVRDYYKKSGEMKAFLFNYPEWTDFRKSPDNQVYISVWAWDPQWKISVKENGKELPVEYLMLENPQYNVSYMLPKTVWEDTFSKGYNAPRTAPMFLVTASGPDTTLEIAVTDSFGNVFTETMTRPKAFSSTMR